MPLYEIMCITTTSATPQQLVNMLQRLAVVVQKGKGVFRRVEHLGVRPLAHRMKAHMKYNEAGRYVRLFIQASPVLCQDIETRLRVDDHVVKTMTIKHKQAAPVVVEKRVTQKHVESSSVTGVLSHAPILEYDVAKALLSLGLLRSDDILALPRYAPDAGWEATRQQELLKRAHGGRSEAARVLQVPIPTRAQDLADMAKLAEAEEAHMQAYEDYRAADIQRRLGMKAQYNRDEEDRKDERLRWYEQQAGQIRTRALVKRLGLSEDKALKLLAKGDPRPAWRNRVQNMLEKNRLRNEELRGILAELAAEKAQKLADEKRSLEETGETLDPRAVEEEEDDEEEGEEGAVEAAAESDAAPSDALVLEGDEQDDALVTAGGSLIKDAVAHQRKLGAQDYLAEIGATPEFDVLKEVDQQVAVDEAAHLWESMEAAILNQSEGQLDELVERWGEVQSKLDPEFSAQFGAKSLEQALLDRNPRIRREAEVLAQEAVEAEEAEDAARERYQSIAGLSDEERALVNKREASRIHAHSTLRNEDATKAERRRAQETLDELAAIDKAEAELAAEEAREAVEDQAIEEASKEDALVASVPSMAPKHFARMIAQLDRKIGIMQAAADFYENNAQVIEEEQEIEEGEEEGEEEDAAPKEPMIAPLTREQEFVLDTLRHRAARAAHLRSILQSTRDGTPITLSLAQFDSDRSNLLEARMEQAREDLEEAQRQYDTAQTAQEKREAAEMMQEAFDNMPWNPEFEARMREDERAAAAAEEAEQRAPRPAAMAAAQAEQQEEIAEGEEEAEEEEEPQPKFQQQKKKPHRSPRK